MKITALSSRRKGFTLVELLVVMAIVAALAAIASTIIIRQVDKAKLVGVKEACTSIANAIDSFYTDNNTFPVTVFPRPGQTITTAVEDPHQVIAILTGREKDAGDKVNRTDRKYLTGSSREDKQGGLYIDGTGAGYYDEWYQPFYILLDVNGRDEIDDPFTGRPIINKKALVYSTGPDGTGNAVDGSNKKAENNEDNVYSWR